VHRKLPEAVEVTAQAVPRLEETVTDEVGANPVPLRVTVLPTVTEEGETERLVPTVNVALAVFPNVSVAVNSYEPPGADGNGSVQLTAPSGLDVLVHQVPKLHAIVTGTDAPNPVALKVTDVPAMPPEGWGVSCGVTVNVAEAMSP
jgi:hypothetical protein